jgi:hypothetical protein
VAGDRPADADPAPIEGPPDPEALLAEAATLIDAGDMPPRVIAC